MSENRQKLLHLRSDVEKVPSASDLNYGEIAIQYLKSKPVLYIKNTDNEIVKFIDENAIRTILSGYVVTGDFSALSGIVESLSSTTVDIEASAHTHDNKSTLDNIDASKVSNWDEAYASAHTHDNKSVLDTITSAKTEQWDSAYTVSQSALCGIESGKSSGAEVNANNELDFSSLYIDCGVY